jgi:polyribonucleotide nucleotidyltransferase
MAAGVPIKEAVAGVAMGLIKEGEKTAVLTDILGTEDHLGDMDFKVCGTKDGITACQMDIKINGLSSEIMAEALEQARKGRLHILDKINEAMPTPREDYKQFVPRIVQLVIPKEFIGAVIGPAGKIIQEMQRETNTVINIEEKDGMGYVDVAAANLDDVQRAIDRIKAITTIPEVGEVYDGVVKGLQSFGAFVEFLPNTEGLLHVSEIAYQRIENVEDVLKEGDEIKVKLIAIDDRGKYKLSHRALLPKPEDWVEPPARPARAPRSGGDRRDRGDRGERRPRNDNRNRPPRNF